MTTPAVTRILKVGAETIITHGILDDGRAFVHWDSPRLAQRGRGPILCRVDGKDLLANGAIHMARLRAGRRQ